VAGDLQDADRFDVTVTALRAAQRLTRQRSTCRSHGVDRVRLALAPTDLPVRPVDFDDTDAGSSEVPAQTGPIGPGALDTDEVDLTMRTQPGHQLRVASHGRRERLDTEHTTDGINHGSHMHIGVRVDTRGH